MKRKIVLFFLVGWLFLIFCLSHEPSKKTTHTTNSFSETVLTTINFCIGNVFSKKEIHDISTSLFVVVRKGAHIFLYFVLSILVFLFFKEVYIKKDLFLVTIFFCLFCACTDEIHQLFIEGRSGQIVDVFVDSIGILLGLCSSFFYVKCRERRL